MPERKPDEGGSRPRRDLVREPITHPVEPTRVEIGDVMCTYDYGTPKQYGRVVQVGIDHTFIRLADLDKEHEDDEDEFTVNGRDRIVAMASANYFAETVKTGRTVMVTLMVRAEGTPFTVHYIEKDGQERTLRGHIAGKEQLGRSLCRDLELPVDGKRLRRVNHQTVMWLIVGGVRYELEHGT